MKKMIMTVLVITCFSLTTYAQITGEFRGIGRTGIYNEKGLLKEWPEGGPEVLWTLENIPIGHSSMSYSHSLLYLTGKKEDMDVVFAIDNNGKVKWETVYGRAWNASYPNSRATPTIDGDRLYVSSGLGDIACVNALSGKIIWQMKASEEFKGTFGRWGIAESLLVLGDKVYYTPGGNETCMIALNKMTGKLIWKSKTLNDKPSYVSPLIIKEGGNTIIVNVTEKFIFGIDPESGNMHWTYNFGELAGGAWKANIHANTAIYDNFKLFVTSGYDHKNVMLSLSNDLKEVSFVRSGDVLDNHHGGVVKVGNYVYGPNWKNNAMGNWICYDWNTGKIMYDTNWKNKGSIVSADGMLYCYEEKTGNLALVEATPKGFNIKGTLQMTLGKKGPYWSHPFINNGILYVRHGDAIMAFKVKK